MAGAVRGLEGHRSIWQGEKTAEGLRREIFSSSPPCQGQHGSEAPGRENGAGPFPSIGHQMQLLKFIAQTPEVPTSRPSPEVLLDLALTCNASWLPLPLRTHLAVSQGRLATSPAPAQGWNPICFPTAHCPCVDARLQPLRLLPSSAPPSCLSGLVMVW